MTNLRITLYDKTLHNTIELLTFINFTMNNAKSLRLSAWLKFLSTVYKIQPYLWFSVNSDIRKYYVNYSSVLWFQNKFIASLLRGMTADKIASFSQYRFKDAGAYLVKISFQYTSTVSR